MVELVHHAEEVTAKLVIGDHVRVAQAATQDGAWVHGSIYTELMPSHDLQSPLIVRLHIPNAATIWAPQAAEFLYGCLTTSCQNPVIAVARSVGVRTKTQPRPAILPHNPLRNLLCANYGDTTHNGCGWESGAKRLLDSNPILYQDNATLGAHKWCYQQGVIRLIWQSLGGQNDIMPNLSVLVLRSGG